MEDSGLVRTTKWFYGDEEDDETLQRLVEDVNTMKRELAEGRVVKVVVTIDEAPEVDTGLSVLVG